jgi:hypothetical protein
MPLATWSPISKADLALALLLMSLSVIYSLAVTGWEKARRHLLYERTPAMTPNVLTTWRFAAAILLPPEVAALVTAVSAIGGWTAYNPAGTRRAYRYNYSTMVSVLATATAGWLLQLHLPLAVVLTASAGAWLAIEGGATGLVLLASGQFGAAKSMLRPRTYRLEVVTMAVAAAEYATHQIGLPLIWLSLPAAVGIQRYFTTAELRARESLARPMDEQAWLHIAKVIVEASVTVTVLRIDAADSQTARMVAMMQGGCDAIGTYPHGGLAILLPDCPPANGDALARRLRIAMKHHKVDCNIASASKSRDGQSVDDLLAVCEAELVISREASRRSANST